MCTVQYIEWGDLIRKRDTTGIENIMYVCTVHVYVLTTCRLCILASPFSIQEQISVKVLQKRERGGVNRYAVGEKKWTVMAVK